MLSFVRWLAVVWVLGAGAALAQSFPALYDVSGVASNDVLNVRSGPGVQFGVVGALAHDATRVSVTAIDGNWAQVNAGETAGWAALKYLSARPPVDLTTATRVTCSGTEPFWSLDTVPGDKALLTTPDSPLVDVFKAWKFKRLPASLEKYLLHGEATGRELSVLAQPAVCNDGMSDRVYAIDVTVIVSGTGWEKGGVVYAGCCALSD